MTVRQLGRGLQHSFNDLNNNHTLFMAAGLAYYFLLSLFPLLIVLAGVVPYLMALWAQPLGC